jgi:hypothetical protein
MVSGRALPFQVRLMATNIQNRPGGWKIIILAVLLILFVSLSTWNYLFGYRSSSLYQCGEPLIATFTPPYVPLVGEFLFVDSLEVYLGGWIESGRVTISGDILADPITFERGERITTISYAHMGEWYDSDFTLNFQPEDHTSCAVRVIYRFRGIY